MSLLRAEALSKEFGGVRAVESLSFAIPPGTVYSIIGPNGAGKTTLLNLLTGIYVPSGGRIFLEEAELTGRAPHEFAAAGVARTFQNLQVFFNMSALENVMVGRYGRERCSLATALLRTPALSRAERACREEAAELMRFVGLAEWLDARAEAMPYGALKRLEIARALATEPRMLLLDEPAAGLNAAEMREIGELIGKLASRGHTIVLVEHNMRLVMGVSDQVLVLDYGRKLAEGAADEVRRDPRVIEAYLGSAAASGARLEAPPQRCTEMLEIRALESHYGRIPALKGIDLRVAEGELAALVGANGAGKTTLLRALSGVQRVSAGQVVFRGEDITRASSDRRVRLGIVQVPEGRLVFAPLSVEDNLRLGGYTRTRAESKSALEQVFTMFPALGERRRQPAGTLSGGQQQMLAIGRAMMARPKLMLLDEPSMGLAPRLVEEIFAYIRALKASGTTIFLVDQNARAALSAADRGYVLETGCIVHSGAGTQLLEDEQVQQAYLGI